MPVQPLTTTLTATKYQCEACGGLKFCIMFVANNDAAPDDCPVVGVTTVAEWMQMSIKDEVL